MSLVQGSSPPDSPLERIAGSAQLAWSILEPLPGAAFIVVDTELRVVAAGGAGLRRQGFGRELMVGRELRDVIPESAMAVLRDVTDTRAPRRL